MLIPHKSQTTELNKFLIYKLRLISFVKKIKRMSSNSQSLSYNAGQAKGQTQEKASNLMDKASNAAQSAKESVQETGQQMKQKAQGAGETIKEKTGMNN